MTNEDKDRKDTIDKLKDEILGGKGTVLEYLEWRTIHDFLANYKPGQTTLSFMTEQFPMSFHCCWV